VSVSAANGAHALVVLLVEDEFFARYDVANCLRDAGYVVIETASGEEAIALCNSDTSIDMVFTDINLIGAATGWDVAECFRIERPDVPILYTSGKLIDPSRCVPGSVFIPKPYNSTDILNACQRLHTV
jgi:CheY-like chemotaxis protein